MVNSEFDVDVSPTVTSLYLFKNLTFTPHYALGEFIDNSITSALLSEDQLRSTSQGASTLKVSITMTADEIVISDNAAGIRKEEFYRVLVTGEPPPPSDRGLSVHGAGMKAAAFWWADSLEISTWPIGSSTGWQATLDLNSVVSDDGRATVRPIPMREASGTTIRLKNLNQSVRRLGTVRAYLPSIYRLFLAPNTDESSMKMVLELNGEALEYSRPPLLSEPFWPNDQGPGPGATEQLWRRDVKFSLSSGRTIAGWVGLLDKTSRELTGFFMHFRGKGVAGATALSGEKGDVDLGQPGAYKPVKIFGQKGNYVDISLVGEFDVSDFGKALTTDSIKWSTDDEEEFVEKMLALLSDENLNMLTMARQYRRSKKKRSKKEIEDIDATSSDIITTFGDRASSAGLSHEEPHITLWDTPINSEPEICRVSDQEGHTHILDVYQMDDNPQRPLIELQQRQIDKSDLIINELHPLLSEVQPLDSESRRLLLNFALTLCTAEVLGNADAGQTIRAKMEEVAAHMYRTIS